MQETSTALTTAQSEVAAKNWDQNTSALEAQISTCEEAINEVQRELSSTSAQSDMRAKIDVLHADITKKAQARTVLIQTHSAKFRKHVEADLGPGTLDSQLNVVLRRRQDELEDAEKLLEGTTKEITGLEAKLTAAKEQLKEKRREKNQAYDTIMGKAEVDDIDSFPNLVKEYEINVEDLKL